MQLRKTKKLVIDYDKLQVLFRLGCDDSLIIDALKLKSLRKTGDRLIDDILESFIDYREFDNWGGRRKGAGRLKKNQLENQDENQLENQDDRHLAEQEQEQEKDVGFNFLNSVNSDIRNTRDNKSDIPTLEEFLDYAKQQNDMAGVGGFPCSPEIASACYDYYATNGWRRANKENTPVRDWKSALRAWARKENQNNDSQKRSF